MRTEKQSVYIRIKEDVKRKIELGLLGADERLASCRELAMKMGINPNTVQRAYAELEAEGYIYTQPKKGVYVCAKQNKTHIEQSAREKLAELKNAGLSREKLLELIGEVYGGKYD